VAHPQIAAFARLANVNTPPSRTLEGQKTLISRTMHALAYDPMHDEIVVSSPLASAVLTFRGAANGEEPPVRVIQGPHTQILGTNDKVSIDPANNEILASSRNAIVVFDRMANGDVPPKRVLSGPDTQLLIGTGGGPGLGQVDPMRDLLLVNTRGKMLIFDRTAKGNTAPKAVIEGPKSEMADIYIFQLYPPKGWVIAACAEGTAVCAWSVTDNGDVPPRWKIPVHQLTGYYPTALAIDPVHKELMISAVGPQPTQSAFDGRPRKPQTRPASGIMNTVITFSWPEVF
jgi:hypothetical protein